MPLTPEEPQIHESVPGPRSSAGSTRNPQTPRPVPAPGPRPAPPRPAPPGGGPAARTRPGPGRPGAPRPPAPAATPPPPVPGAGAGARVQLVPATDSTAVETADETVDRLLDSGRAPGDILVLTTAEQHPWALHELSFGEDAYWKQLDEGGDVFYAHATAERAARRAVVVLAVNGGTDEQAAAALPAAMARAAEELHVCGDPQRLRALAGEVPAPA
ncbi:hypothetical protein ODJ75_21835 [Streptomyces sp. HB2AG]|nr:hypothetical protein [Streptomyces sp. HB2AG]